MEKYIPESLEFEMGFDAAMDGEDITANPFDHKYDSCRYNEWRRGYEYYEEEEGE